ncbi:UDP-N-acetylmuramate dehydrogenase [Aurantibacter crassamenti]|uniref:UDP-N-acetylmuramate dehydrogenase n=1 Tax=Aurantibacter crassamenti TaxID=1837375 RepID=UPI001939F5DE|nr:UDP-N-acetylmuramate dehydrogenase [Aurantibacter crassamenti]MBM1108031.1 UDP-N-acetylmuramate dehydrogenase [Aurantibacter crassamenti]
MEVQQDISLKNYNTFGINSQAKYFAEINSEEDLRTALSLNDYPKKFIISGGSNMLLTGAVNAFVLHINIKGISIVKETENNVTLKINAGENWHELVLWTLEQNYGGLENMSLIPGNVGTAPIQNIGAYGVELKDTFVSCEAMHMQTQEIKSFSKSECKFGYRDSFFKNEGKGLYVITSVTLELTKKNHCLNTSYGAIETELERNNISNPTLKDISNAVIAIRQSKLPDPKVLGNSGSFFKNPVVSKSEFGTFSKKHPEAPFYKVSDDAYKIPAGWLIEQCGYKGKRFGDAGVHKNQALVLVNYGNATGKELLDLAYQIIEAVQKRFGIAIAPEVNIIK